MKFDRVVEQMMSVNAPTPVNLPTPEEKQKKAQAFQQQQQKSVEDITNLGKAAFEVAKFFDPSGILSWGDVKTAYDAFVASTTPQDQTTNGLALTLAVGSVIPMAGKVTYPIKAAVKAGRTAEVAGLLAPLMKIVRGVLGDTATLQRMGMDAGQLNKAFQTAERADPRMIKSGFKHIGGDSYYRRPQRAAQPGKISSQNFINSWDMGKYRSTDKAVDVIDEYALAVKEATAGLRFDPSQIKILRYQKDWNGRDFAEIQLPLSGPNKILLYKSRHGTEGKTIGWWYLTRGLIELPSRRNPGQFSTMVSKTAESVNATEGGSAYMTELARYLNKNYSSLFN